MAMVNETEKKNYDADPDALAWARGKVQFYVDKARRFARTSNDNAEQWHRIANILEMWLLPSDEGCVIGPFDSRRALPYVQDLLVEMEKKAGGR
jgi:hypothetical protein